MSQKQSFLSKLFRGDRINYNRKTDFLDKIKTPSVIADKHKELFIAQAKNAGVTTDEFGAIAKREQGPNTLPGNAALVGGADPTDRGVMQVNKVNEPLVRQRFIKEFGRKYNPNEAADSIIAASMVLQENRRTFEQMKLNQTIQDFSSTDLIDSYNLGPSGLVQAKQGDRIKQDRLERYRGAELGL